MFPSLVAKTLRDSRWSYMWWAAGLFAYIILISLVFPFLEERGDAFQELLENYPPALLAAFGIDTTMSIVSVEGFLATYVFGWFVPLVVIVFSVSFGSRAIAGEEEAGTMDLLLANPVPRRMVVLAKASALAVLVFGLSSVIVGGVLVGGLLVGWELDVANLVAASLSAGLLGIMFGGLSTMLGAATGRRGLTSGLSAAVAFAAYLLFTAGGLVDGLANAAKASPIWLYAGTETIAGGLHPARAGIMLVVAVATVVVAAALFQHRDVRS